MQLVDYISTQRPKDGGLKNHLFDQHQSTLPAASETDHKRTQHSVRVRKHACKYPGCLLEYSRSEDLRFHQSIKGHETDISGGIGRPSTLEPSPSSLSSGGPLDILADAAHFHDSMPPPSNLAPLTLPPFGFLQASNKHTSPLTPPTSAVPNSAEETGQESKQGCNACRRLKIMCTGGKPCLRCQQTKCLCIYDPWYANDRDSGLFQKVDGIFLHKSPEIGYSRHSRGRESSVAVSENVPVIIETGDMDIDPQDPKPPHTSVGTTFGGEVRERSGGSLNSRGKENMHVAELEPPSEDEDVVGLDESYEYNVKGEKMTEEEQRKNFLDRNRSVMLINSLN